MLIGVDEPLSRGRGWPAASLHLQVFGRPGQRASMKCNNIVLE